MTNHIKKLTLLAAATVLAAAIPGALQAGGKIEIDYKRSDFDNPTIIDNQLWPLTPRMIATYAAEGEECEVNTTYVADPDNPNDPIAPFNVKNIEGLPGASLPVIVVYDVAWIDEECDGNLVLEEFTFDWHAQDNAGRVWYLGEETYDCEDGECEMGDGAWEAGVDGAIPGIIMLADPHSGDQYDQEFLEDLAEDKGKVLRTDTWVSLYRDDALDPADFHHCLKTKEWTPLEHGHVEHKFYCPGVGLVAVDELKGRTVRFERVSPVVQPPWPPPFPEE